MRCGGHPDVSWQQTGQSMDAVWVRWVSLAESAQLSPCMKCVLPQEQDMFTCKPGQCYAISLKGDMIDRSKCKLPLLMIMINA